MMRTVLTIAVVQGLLAAAAGNAHAQGHTLKVLEHAYELALDDIVFPGSTAGSVIVKPCEDCDSVTHRVTSSTVYLLNGTAVPLDEFLRVAEDWQGRDDGPLAAVGVYIDIESERVNRILLRFAG